MGNAVDIRTDFTAGELRRLAGKAKDTAQSRRLLSAAAVLDGMNRTEAARIGGMDRQTLRDWVPRFNREGPDGLKDRPGGGKPSALSAGQRAQLAAIVEAGPDPAVHGVVRWRRVDLQRVIRERFGIEFHERYAGTILRQLGFVKISSRPKHPQQDAKVIDMFN